ncbi:hypothetical protein [Pontimicrobium sp. MEBiC01747]
MKIQKGKLEFKKNDLVELNSEEMLGVNGGTASTTILTTVPCVVAASVVAVSVIIIATDAAEGGNEK